ncbi:DUF2752 domain-containing protein [Polaribacter septentrionalilitoris]|uniref:DUF2752 domain-containing protein n=1 Tax=Polaribacter septentrionalilitoris TaxID=2494657 RepID=UPI00135BE629|nr:DUF2752 domain-containing protein [Polaribacter septentrionalilitoris]
MFATINDYLLPCLNKSLFGIDCPGCGLQRALISIFKGEFKEAFFFFPAVYTLLILLIFFLINLKYKYINGQKIIIKLAAINVLIIVVNYIIKIKPLFIN